MIFFLLLELRVCVCVLGVDLVVALMLTNSACSIFFNLDTYCLLEVVWSCIVAKIQDRL